MHPPTPRRVALRSTIVPVLAASLAAATANAENWPMFRGPRMDGASLETDVPREWDREKNVRWVAEVPGEGHASPIVWEDSVFVATAIGDGADRMLLRFDARTGAELWRVAVVRSYDVESRHAENNYASSTPATDGERVFTSFYANGRARIAAHDFDGREVWSAEPVAYEGEHGYNHTPCVWNGLAIVSIDQLKEAAIVAFDAATGAERWRIPTDNYSCSNVPPRVVELAGTPTLLTYGNTMTRAIDPATGAVRWSWAGPTEYCVAVPVVGDGVIVVCGGWPDRRTVALPIAGEGATREPVWETKKGSTYVPSPLHADGAFFVVNDGGIALCYDAKTGDVLWQERVGGKFRASVLRVGDDLFATNEEGTTTVFKASREGFVRVAENRLEEFCFATPAISGGRVFLRTGSRLYCVGAPPAAGGGAE